ncbi:hypothetical protein QCE49_12805 [Caballeronia sp. LZ008]|uniref:hypothetical protein n=1 Tax=unclassified Caballeronia TaxID=2646786 RepID=UPI002027A806|nr:MULTISPECIES: hypothetical protein [unclassified Caballeronia]MDR5794253.1 hypothetical protein [Caballeronia sp. LZ008]
MANSYEGRYCGVCDRELGRSYFALSKRSQTVTCSEPGVVLVSDDNGLTDFCGQECADYAEAAISSTLTSAYPTAAKTVPCSLCLRPVDRTAPHVSVAMTQFEDASEPWLVSARVVAERELAVYCHTCAEHRRTSEAFDESELGVAV